MVTSEEVALSGITIGIDLPWEFKEHCVAKMNTSHHIMIGGNKYPKSTLIVNSNIFNIYTSGPDLAGDGRYQHACAHIKHKNGSNYVIAVGGYLINEPDNNVALQTTEILDVDNKGSWVTGKGYMYIV